MIWKDVDGFEGLYQVSDTGLIRSLDRLITQENRDGYAPIKRLYKGRILKCRKDKDGYLRVCLCKQGDKKKFFFLHRLVALTFVDGYFNDAVVNHKDGNKFNNNAENLEWCTVQHNNTHAYSTGLKQACLEVGKKATSSKYVISIFKDGNHIIDVCGVEEFNSFGKSRGLSYSSMLNFFRGTVKQYKGYTFTRRLKSE